MVALGIDSAFGKMQWANRGTKDPLHYQSQKQERAQIRLEGTRSPFHSPVWLRAKQRHERGLRVLREDHTVGAGVWRNELGNDGPGFFPSLTCELSVLTYSLGHCILFLFSLSHLTSTLVSFPSPFLSPTPWTMALLPVLKIWWLSVIMHMIIPHSWIKPFSSLHLCL